MHRLGQPTTHQQLEQIPTTTIRVSLAKSNKTKHQWLGNMDWAIWDVVITSVFNVGRYSTLPCKLGNFHGQPKNGWFYSPDDQALWHANEREWTQHSKIPSWSRSRTQSFHWHGDAAEAPDKVVHRAMVHIQGKNVILTNSSPIDQITNTHDPMTNLQTQPFYRMWNWELIVVGNLQRLEADILAGKGFAVSDGSFQLGKGAAAWIIEGRNNQNQIIGTCISPSNNRGHSSFQSKLASIQAIMLTLTPLFVTKHQIHIVACDGKSILSWLNWLRITDPQEPHVDLLSATCLMICNSRIPVKLHHVKCQRDNHQFRPFNCDATLNIEVDLLAKTKLTTYTSVPAIFHIPWSQGACYIRNVQVEKDFGHQISDHINKYKLGKKPCTLPRHLEQDQLGVNWLSNAGNTSQPKRWVAKYVSGHFVTRKICRGGSSACQHNALGVTLK